MHCQDESTSTQTDTLMCKFIKLILNVTLDNVPVSKMHMNYNNNTFCSVFRYQILISLKQVVWRGMGNCCYLVP